MSCVQIDLLTHSLTHNTFDSNSELILCILKVFAGEWRVDASATLQLQMLRYENPAAKDYGGLCCDMWCWSNCDHIFRFALDRGNRYIYSIT